LEDDAAGEDEEGDDAEDWSCELQSENALAIEDN